MRKSGQKTQNRAPPAFRKGALPVELQLVRRNGVKDDLLRSITDVATYCTRYFRKDGGRGKKVRVVDWERLAVSISAGIEAHYPRQVWHCAAGHVQPHFNMRYRRGHLVVFNVNAAHSPLHGAQITVFRTPPPSPNMIDATPGMREYVELIDEAMEEQGAYKRVPENTTRKEEEDVTANVRVLSLGTAMEPLTSHLQTVIEDSFAATYRHIDGEEESEHIASRGIKLGGEGSIQEDALVNPPLARRSGKKKKGQKGTKASALAKKKIKAEEDGKRIDALKQAVAIEINARMNLEPTLGVFPLDENLGEIVVEEIQGKGEKGEDASAVNVTVRRWNIIAGSDEFGLGLGGTTTPFSFRAVVRAKARGGKRRHPPVYLYAFAHDLYGDADDSLGQTEMTWETPKLAFAGLVSSLAMFLYAVSGASILAFLVLSNSCSAECADPDVTGATIAVAQEAIGIPLLPTSKIALEKVTEAGLLPFIVQQVDENGNDDQAAAEEMQITVEQRKKEDGEKTDFEMELKEGKDGENEHSNKDEENEQGKDGSGGTKKETREVKLKENGKNNSDSNTSAIEIIFKEGCAQETVIEHSTCSAWKRTAAYGAAMSFAFAALVRVFARVFGGLKRMVSRVVARRKTQ